MLRYTYIAYLVTTSCILITKLRAKYSEHSQTFLFYTLHLFVSNNYELERTYHLIRQFELIVAFTWQQKCSQQ
jgi:hypothetical protein